MEIKKPLIGSLSAMLCLASVAIAQSSNDFFGSSVPAPGTGGSGSSIERPPGVAAAEQQALKQGGGDYTSDEKRMQKKFKANLRAAEGLIAKAEKMVKDGEKRKDEKMAKKGRILKEVAEKRVAELKEQNPFPEIK